MWIESDWFGLSVLIRLVDRAQLAFAGELKAPASLFGEIRAWEDMYGLNPKARRGLRWRIDDTAPDDTNPTTPQKGRWHDLRSASSPQVGGQLLAARRTPEIRTKNPTRQREMVQNSE